MSTAHLSTHSSLRGLALMAAAMLLVPNVDAIAKTLSANHSPLLVSWARYACACLFVVPWAFARRGKNILPRQDLPLHALRTVLASASMCFFFVAISYSPLADVTAAYFVGPIVAALLAVWLLGEAMTLRKIVALILGFIGALIVVNPSGEIKIGIVLGVIAGTCFGCYVIATRKASGASDPISTLAFQCLFGALIMSPLAIWNWSTPHSGEIWLFLMMGLISATCHFLTISAFRHAEASLLAPLSYLELPSAVALGYLLFGDFPTAQVWLGATLIVAAGLILMLRRRSKEVGVSN